MKAFDDTHNLCDHRVLAWKLFSSLIVLQPAVPSLASCSILIVLLLCRHSCDRRLPPPSFPRLADRDRGCIAAAPDYFLSNCIAQIDTGTGGVGFLPQRNSSGKIVT